MKKPELIFLKLGGSLITDKSKLHTVRLQVSQRLTKEIAQAVNANPDLKVILGHGSGSFGHVPAKKHHTVEGLFTPEDKAGFLEVQREAHELHDIFMRESSAAGRSSDDAWVASIPVHPSWTAAPTGARHAAV